VGIKFVLFHVATSGAEVAINVDAISQVSRGAKNDSAYVLRIDGGDVEVKESYEKVLEMLSDNGIRTPKK
jgi:hypothetical protein